MYITTKDLRKNGPLRSRQVVFRSWEPLKSEEEEIWTDLKERTLGLSKVRRARHFTGRPFSVRGTF